MGAYNSTSYPVVVFISSLDQMLGLGGLHMSTFLSLRGFEYQDENGWMDE